MWVVYIGLQQVANGVGSTSEPAQEVSLLGEMMLRSSKLWTLAVMVLGAMIGYATASGGPSWLSKSVASPSEQNRSSQESLTSASCNTGACCDGMNKTKLMAGNAATFAPVTIMTMAPGNAAVQDGEETITFEIVVPVDAVLELNGFKMEPTGESRRFVTPSLKTGGQYTYDVKVASKGKEVARKIQLRHGSSNSFDLRGDFQGVAAAGATPVTAKPGNGKKPNILFIMGDDIGIWNIGAYHRGMMAGRTPNLDKLARDGMLFTDYYAEASCTAGRANFITGQLPIRTGMTTVGQAGAKTGLPAEACTIATALKAQGYATGQFGKNHLGDRNEFLPTVHGFDEFFGYLYHLDAMEDPAHPNYPQELLDKVGPRNMVHSWATDVDDPTEMPRWGKIGKQKIKDAGTLYPKRMETVDDEIRELALTFIEKAKKDDKPFFCWLNPTRMHIVTHLSEKWNGTRNSKNGWSIQEAGMAQLDNDIGLVLQKLKDLGEEENTIVVFTTDNGTELFTWPDGGTTPFAQCKGTIMEGGFRVPCIARWPGHIPAGSIQNGIFSGLDWFPTFLAAAGNTTITDDLLKGVKIGDRTYKNHLDGYNQMSAITVKWTPKTGQVNK
jgi:uncharacterized protein (TIGR03000 family)